jgi:hypothetical protein
MTSFAGFEAIATAVAERGAHAASCSSRRLGQER